MIDTFQISKTFVRSPDIGKLENSGWKPLRNLHTGELTALCFNSGDGEPRLTLSKNRNDLWIIRAEVSIGRWLHGSNLHLPNESELHHGLDSLSEYVRERSGVIFDAHTERVTKVDFTRDFQVGENAVISILAKFAKFNLPRYRRVCFDETSVYFNSRGKAKTKRFLIYSKYDERLAKSGDKSEHEAAKGIIRLEAQFIKAAVNRLAKSLKLPSHHANHIFTEETAEKVMQKAINQLHFDKLLTAEDSTDKKLFELYGATMPYSLIGFLYLRDKYGANLRQQSYIETSPKTLQRYAKDCNKAGVLSLE